MNEIKNAVKKRTKIVEYPTFILERQRQNGNFNKKDSDKMDQRGY